MSAGSQLSASKLRVVLTGATGMVGEGVLLECLHNPDVEHVLMVNRRHSPRTHPKLAELIVPDLFSLDSVVDQLTGFNACFFCAGRTAVGLSEADYTRLTYDLTVSFARVLAALNPTMTFIYISGAGTDSSEKGRLMWARVKGRTENALRQVGFAHVYSFRPGFMRAIHGQRNLHTSYKLVAWLYPVARVVIPQYVSTLRQVAFAMIYVALNGFSKPILEVRDINALSRP
ncbi:MAG: NAD-dependent epimerase/dehydratase family protein [Acidobacteriaceae bacterium]